MQSGLLNFFTAVPDEVFGWRLHMADIAVNKVLAAASRREARDFVDLAMIHEHVMPLWLAIWAAPGKDSAFSPLSLVERLSRYNHFSQAQVDDAVDALMPIDATAVSGKVLDALDEARDVIPKLPRLLAGNLFVDSGGNLVSDLNQIVSGLEDSSAVAIGPIPDGGWPSGPEIDKAILERIISTFGYDGSSIPAP